MLISKNQEKMDKSHLKRMIDSELFDFSENYENQFDFIDFNCENFIEINYDLNIFKTFNTYDSDINFQKNLKIVFDDVTDDHVISTNVSLQEIKSKYDLINQNCVDSIKNYGFINTYIAFGFLRYDNRLAPFIFIPIIIKKDQENFIVCRNYNQEIVFNSLAKLDLDYCGIDVPEFYGDLNNLTVNLKDVEGVEYKKLAYIGNFDLRFQHIFDDLNCEKWESISQKYDMYHHKQHKFSFNDVNILKKNLNKHADALNIDIDDDMLFLRTLLSKNNSILVIADYLKRNKLKCSFKNNGLDSFLLELSGELSKKDVYMRILDNEMIPSESVIELDSLVRKHDVLLNNLNLINENQDFLGMSARDIKVKKDYYLNKIEEFNLSNFTYCFDYFEYFNSENIKDEENHIHEIYNMDKLIFDLYDNVSLDYLYSDHFHKLSKCSNSLLNLINYFINFNRILNEKYSIKIFEDLFSVNKLRYLLIINKNPIYIDKKDFNKLNDFVKDYYAGSYDETKYDSLIKYFNNEDLLTSLDINIKYTELLNDKIIVNESIDLILEDWRDVLKLSKHLNDISNYILKKINCIFEFYKEMDFFTIDENLLNYNNSIGDFKRLIAHFKEDIAKLVYLRDNYIDILNDFNIKFMNYIFENGFKEEEMEVIFWYNIYNSALNNFLKDFAIIEEDKMISEYENEFNEINSKIDWNSKDLLIQQIFSKTILLNNTESAISQKQNLIQNYENGKLNSIKNILTEYKDFITANKRIFIMDIDTVYQFLSNSYESHFDYVILTEDLEFDLYNISLLLRSKYKILKLGWEG